EDDLPADASLSVRRRTRQRLAVRVASVRLASRRSTTCAPAGPRALERSLHAPARSVMGIDSADDRCQSTSETVAGTVPRLAERRIRRTVPLPRAMDGQAADDVVTAPRAASGLRRVPRGSMATAVRRL